MNRDQLREHHDRLCRIEETLDALRDDLDGIRTLLASLTIEEQEPATGQWKPGS